MENVLIICKYVIFNLFLFCFFHSKSSTSPQFTSAAIGPGDLHPLQEEGDAEGHVQHRSSAAPLPPRGFWARGPSHLLPLHRNSAGPQTGTVIIPLYILSAALIYVQVFLISTFFTPDRFHQPHPEQHPEGSSPGGAGDWHLRLQAGQVPCVRQHQRPNRGSPRPAKASSEHHGGAPQLWEVCEW